MKRSLIPLLLAALLFSVNIKAQTNATCNADFTFTVSGNYVDFYGADNTDSASVKHYWNFGNGTEGVWGQFISVAYSAAGTYTVTHTVKRITPNGAVVCEKSVSKNIVIQPASTPCELGAGFNFKRDSLQTNKVYFTNTTTPSSAVTQYKWSFGDGAFSDAVNPVHLFPVSGLYTVCLRVKRGECYEDTCSYVQVQVPGTVPCNLKAGFTVVKDSMNASPLNVYKFTNTSTPADGYDSTFWNFGDGTPVLVNVNDPIHAYTAPGTYSVCLIVKKKATTSTNIPCVSYLCKTIVVGELPPPCNITAYFGFKADSLDKKKIHFTNYSQTTITTARALWSFGDGKQSDSWNTDHVYEKGGTYIVCLRIKQNDTCVREFCKTIIVDSLPNPVPCDFKADFYFKRDSAHPNKVFFNIATPIASSDIVKWGFGDGTYSYEYNPDHVYTVSGLYNVCLYIGRNNTCYDDTCKLVQVNVPQPEPCNIAAYFVSHPDDELTRKIHFTNYSTPLTEIDSVRWTFGDGSASTDINPVHTYNVPGTYNVCIRVQKFNAAGTAPCVKEYCQVVTVKDSCRLKADFTFRKDSMSGIALNTYHFKNTSEPLWNSDSVWWDFGDNTPVVVNDNDPVHVFAQPGTYTVCLTVKKASTVADVVECVKQICKTIVVINPPLPCNLQSYFNLKLDSSEPKKVFFINFSQPVNSAAKVEWSFGDGAGADSWNATHTYYHSGVYTVCLRIKQSDNCYSEFCREIKIDSAIQHDTCNMQVGFIQQPTSTNNQRIYFTNTTVGMPLGAAAYWSFGDGTSAETWNAEHLYAQPGKYYVCLKVNAGPNCIRYTCDTIIVQPAPTNCNSLYAKYEARRDSYMQNKIYFTAVTNIPHPNQVWLITKLFSLDSTVVLHQNNPAYLFKDTGYYNICLVIPADNGCIKVYCNEVRIATTSTPAQCVLQSYPNPASNQVKVNLQLEQAQTIKVSVYDLQNVLMIEKLQAGVTGDNIISLNIETLVPGYYTIRIIYGNNVCYARFQKL